MLYGNTKPITLKELEKSATVAKQSKQKSNKPATNDAQNKYYASLQKATSSPFWFMQNQPKNIYGWDAQIWTPESFAEMKKQWLWKVKQNVQNTYKDTRNKTIEWVMNKMDTWDPITASEVRLMAEWANEDDLWDALDSAMAEWAMIEWLNREKPVEVSWIDKFLRKIPWVTTLQQWISWASSWVMKWVWATIQWLWDAGNWVASQAERINPFNTSGDGSWLFSTPESRAAWVAWQQQFGTDLNTAVDENIATPLMDRYNSSVATEDRNSTPFAVWQELGKIWVTAAATAPLWWAWLLWKAPLLARVAMWAAEWVAWNALYNKASWAEYGDNATTAWVIGGAIPVAGNIIKWAWRLLWVWRNAAARNAIQSADNIVAWWWSRIEQWSKVLEDSNLAKMRDTIQPNMTARELAEARAKWLTTKSGILWKIVALPDSNNINQIKTAFNIWIKEWGDIQSNINKAMDYIAKNWNAKREFLAASNGLVSPNEVSWMLSRIEKPLDVVGDSERIYESIIENAKKLISQSDGTLLWLDDARVAFDDLISKRYPNLYNNPATSSMKETVQAVRSMINEQIATRTPWDTYKTLLREMSNSYDIVDGLAGK